MKLFIIYGLMIMFTVIANVMLKLGVMEENNPSGHYILAFFNWYIVVAVLNFFLAAVCYMFMLKILPLNVAQSFASVKFIAVIMASSFILDEVISVQRWVGVFLIFSGILLISISVR